MKMIILSVFFLAFGAGCGGKKSSSTKNNSQAGTENTNPAAAQTPPAAITTNKKSYNPVKHNPCIKQNLKPDPQAVSGIKIDGQTYDLKKVDELVQKGVCV